MKEALLKAQIRQQTGSKHAAKLRSGGQIPVIIYGHKQKPLAGSLDAHDFTVSLHHGQRLLDVEMDGKREKLLVKAVQYDHLGKDIIHADLMRVDLAEMVKVTVPIELKGTAKGTHQGGIIEEHADHLEVECRVTDIPEKITVSVRDIDVADALHAGQLTLPEGVRLVSDAQTLLVTCHLVAAAKSVEQVEEEAPLAPELIGKEEEKQPEPPESKGN